MHITPRGSSAHLPCACMHITPRGSSAHSHAHAGVWMRVHVGVLHVGVHDSWCTTCGCTHMHMWVYYMTHACTVRAPCVHHACAPCVHVYVCMYMCACICVHVCTPRGAATHWSAPPYMLCTYMLCTYMLLTGQHRQRLGRRRCLTVRHRCLGLGGLHLCSQRLPRLDFPPRRRLSCRQIATACLEL